LGEAAKVDDIPVGKLRHVEIDGKEIVTTNINGKFYYWALRFFINYL